MLLDEVRDRELARDDIRTGVHFFQFPLDQRFNIIPGAIDVGLVSELDARLLAHRLTALIYCCVITEEEGRWRFDALALLFSG